MVFVGGGGGGGLGRLTFFPPIPFKPMPGFIFLLGGGGGGGGGEVLLTF